MLIIWFQLIYIEIISGEKNAKLQSAKQTTSQAKMPAAALLKTGVPQALYHRVVVRWYQNRLLVSTEYGLTNLVGKGVLSG